MVEAGYVSLTELIKLDDELMYEADLYNRLNDSVKHRKVAVVHLINLRDLVFTARTGPSYLRLKTSWYMIDDSYAKVDAKLHVLVGAEDVEAVRRMQASRVSAQLSNRLV